jgi:hypothetical protein
VVVPSEYLVIGHTTGGPAGDGFSETGVSAEAQPVKAFFDSMENLQRLFGYGRGMHLSQIPLFKALWQALDDVGQQLSTANQDPTHRLMVQAAAGSSIALSAGFVSWLLRSGALAAALTSALPAWSTFDPIPVLLARRKKHEQDGDEDDTADPPSEAVENLFRARAMAWAGNRRS